MVTGAPSCRVAALGTCAGDTQLQVQPELEEAKTDSIVCHRICCANFRRGGGHACRGREQQNMNICRRGCQTSI